MKTLDVSFPVVVSTLMVRIGCQPNPIVAPVWSVARAGRQFSALPVDAWLVVQVAPLSHDLKIRS